MTMVRYGQRRGTVLDGENVGTNMDAAGKDGSHREARPRR
jgi:hypothetical protein